MTDKSSALHRFLRSACATEQQVDRAIKALDRLLTPLGSGDPVAMLERAALGQAPLGRIPAGDSDVRTAALMTLRYVRAVGAVRGLVVLIDDVDGKVSQQACFAARRLRVREARAPLLRRLEQGLARGSSMANDAISALEAIGEVAALLAVAVRYGQVFEAGEVIKRLGGPAEAEQLVIALRGASRGACVSIARVLQEMGAKGASASLVALASDREAPAHARGAALEALSALDAEAAHGLLGPLLSEGNPDIDTSVALLFTVRLSPFFADRHRKRLAALRASCDERARSVIDAVLRGVVVAS